jgi:hypothetical protein
MMAKGLLGFGEEELGSATKGLIRADELEEQINVANMNLQAESTMQQKQMEGSMIGVGATGGWMAATSGASGAAMGAEFGAAAGPVGAMAGMALGFLVSKLF